jgi:transcriptional regulator with XRE-family HTH domain
MIISSRIKKLIDGTKVTQKDVAEAIGYTAHGFSKALKTDDFRVSFLEKVSEYFHVPITYWFSDQEGNFFLNNEGNFVNGSSFKGNLTLNKGVEEPRANYAASDISKENELLRKENEMLKQLLASKDETIQALKSK